jgi:hypothetical protein
LNEGYPPLIKSEPYYDNDHFFILYNDKLYYQSGMAWIYKLASIQRVDRKRNASVDKWEKDGAQWIKEVPDDLLTNLQIINS